MPGRVPDRLEVADYVAGVRAGDRSVLSRAITLVESTRLDDRRRARRVLAELLPTSPQAHRIGITGVPGAGKSTLIDALAGEVLQAGGRVAVIAVDPTSVRSGGSVLGDKTRMEKLARHERAYVRPSPSRGAAGGVSLRTPEVVALCEAAGFDLVIVETVGVGQSETSVVEMVDTFLLLTLAGGGDDLQAVKRGVLELADVIAINKADGPNVGACQRLRKMHESAMHLLRPRDAAWAVPVLTCSAVEARGIAELWAVLRRHRSEMTASGSWQTRRERQRVAWMWRAVERRLWGSFRNHADVGAIVPATEAAVRCGELSSDGGAAELLGAFGIVDDLDVE